MEKVVKCKKCDLYFGHSENNIKCPFCHIEYGKVEEKPKEKKEVTKTQVEEKPKEKKEVTKTQKKSFKIWKDK